jgi:fimbrial chaperone protein
LRRFLAIGFLPLLLLGLCSPPSAPAGSFKAIPIRIFFEKKARTAVLKVVNESDERLTLQLSAVRWYQDDSGKDKNEPTDDIIFFPRMAHIEAAGSLNVRIGYDGPPPGPVERTYRIYLEELPVAKPGEVAVKIAVRMGVPIFIKPVADVRQWKIERFELGEGGLSAWIRNGGSGHLVVTALKTTAFDDTGAVLFSRKAAGWYILPGILKRHVLELSREECLKARSLKLEVEAGGSGAEASLPVDKALCPQKAQAPAAPALRRAPDAGADGG